MLKKKKVLIVIGGGIAAYKSLDLIRILKKNNFDIRTILTKSGKEFVTPLSITSLTGEKPFENLFDSRNESEIDHISLSRWADIILVVPTTANFISKLSSGRADDLASTVILASNKDIFLVPAMNVRMWLHKATQTNIAELKNFGYKLIGPINGEMACGEYGEGKMSSPRQIYKHLKEYFLNKDLVQSKKLKAIVTAGPTREYLDPIRYISNESSGKQGIEIANSLSRLGVKTTLVLGPSNLIPDKNVKLIKIVSAREMFEKVKKLLPVDIAICSAAVSDMRPSFKKKTKLKKNKEDIRNIDLTENPDILDFLGKTNKDRPKLVVGFSAETEDLVRNSEIKLKTKHCDYLIANDVSKKEIGFNSDYNEVTILDKFGDKTKIKKNKKSYIATLIVEKIINKLLADGKNFN
tara:strand:- start:1796 stop:3022 length:1227 start_codon:yes stop_codon:yes gene_type:complete